MEWELLEFKWEKCATLKIGRKHINVSCKKKEERKEEKKRKLSALKKCEIVFICNKSFGKNKIK